MDVLFSTPVHKIKKSMHKKKLKICSHKVKSTPNMLALFFYLLTYVLTANATEAPKLSECEVTAPVTEASHLYSIKDCQVIIGNLEIESLNSPLLELDHLQAITGDLVIKDSSELVRVEAPWLSSIGGGFKMKKLTSLSLISFPSLRSVKELDWRVIPILSNVRFNSEISDVESIVISDTSLIGFSGFQTKTLKNLDINNNRFLEVLNSNVETITGKLHIVSNAKTLQVSLPYLTSVTNVSINDVMDMELNNLSEISESISVIDNNFDYLRLPSLTKIGGTLSISKNARLKTIDLSSLNEINGGLMVINNTQITKLDFLKNLTKIDGGIELTGPLVSADFPSLKLVKGSAKIKSSNPNFDCTSLIKNQLSMAVRGGKLECTSSGVSHDDDGQSVAKVGGSFSRSAGTSTFASLLTTLFGFFALYIIVSF